MKILNVIASMAPESGGPCQGLRNSIPELRKLDCYNCVICLDDPSASFLGKDPFPVIALGPGKSPWAYSSKLLPWLIENLPQFDVVFIHGLWLYHGYAVHKALTKLRKSAQFQSSPIDNSSSSSNSQPSTLNSQLLVPAKPQSDAGSTSPSLPKYYVMSHGMLDPYFQRDPSRRLKAIRNWIYWKLIEGKVVNDADGILFTCEEELLLARQTFRPYRPQRELNVGYGVAEPPAKTPAMAAAFAAACPGLDGQPYLLFLSRIHPKKGVDLLIRAYSELVKSDSQPSTNNPQPLPSLVIAGPLDSAYAREMQKLAADLLPSPSNSQPLVPAKPQSDAGSTLNSQLPPPRILFPGMLSGDAKWGAFHGCDAFVLPSHQENFGIAVVEALACGKPVLISKQVNIWREIIDSGAGTSAEDTSKGTAALLEGWLMGSEGTRNDQSNKARSTFDQYFSTRNAAIRMFDAIVPH